MIFHYTKISSRPHRHTTFTVNTLPRPGGSSADVEPTFSCGISMTTLWCPSCSSFCCNGWFFSFQLSISTMLCNDAAMDKIFCEVAATFCSSFAMCWCHDSIHWVVTAAFKFCDRSEGCKWFDFAVSCAVSWLSIKFLCRAFFTMGIVLWWYWLSIKYHECKILFIYLILRIKRASLGSKFSCR